MGRFYSTNQLIVVDNLYPDNHSLWMTSDFGKEGSIAKTKKHAMHLLRVHRVHQRQEMH